MLNRILDKIYDWQISFYIWSYDNIKRIYTIVSMWFYFFGLILIIVGFIIGSLVLARIGCLVALAGLVLIVINKTRKKI